MAEQPQRIAEFQVCRGLLTSTVTGCHHWIMPSAPPLSTGTLPPALISCATTLRFPPWQEEVLALARKEMSTSGFLPENTSSGIASDVSIGRVATPGGSGVNPAAPLDPEAAIDELRSEIAYARASLNDIRAKQRTSSAQN